MDSAPYFIHPVIEALRKEENPEKRRKLKEILAVNIPDLEALRAVMGEDSEDFYEFYPDTMPKHRTTDDTIDTFIDRFGSKGPDTIDSLLTQSGSSDYFASMGIMDTDEPDSLEEAKEETEENEREVRNEGVHGDLTSGFAKILIKNGNYGKALEIIKEINLKNPEKSIYFADQIRFIKKLMLNESKKKTKTT